MKVLITGGAGYIGSHVNRFFLSRGIETAVLDDLSASNRIAVTGGEFIKGSFHDRALMAEIFKSHNIDAVLHFAAFVSVPESVIDPSPYYRNNVANMQILLDCCIDAKINYFAFASSAAIFGDPEYLPMDEKHPQNPLSPDGFTKIVGEKLLADYERAYGLRSVVIRTFSVGGASKDALIGEAHIPEIHLIPVILDAIKTGNPVDIYGDRSDTPDGTYIRDYTHVLDLAEGFYYGLKYIMRYDISATFNMGSGVGVTNLQLIRQIEKMTGKKVPYHITSRREFDPYAQVADSKKAREILGWIPSHSSIEEIVTDAIRWGEKRKY